MAPRGGTDLVEPRREPRWWSTRSRHAGSGRRVVEGTGAGDKSNLGLRFVEYFSNFLTLLVGPLLLLPRLTAPFAMPVTKISHAKPLKPYRRGETLGNASRAGKPTGKTTAGRSRKVVPKAVEESEEEEDEEEDELEDEEEVESEEDERMAIPAPLLKGRGKKGKTFVESQVCSLSFRTSTRAHLKGLGRAHVARQLDNGVTGDEQESQIVKTGLSPPLSPSSPSIDQ